MAADERAEYPAGQKDCVVHLHIPVAGRFAEGAGRPFGGADSQDQTTGDEHGGRGPIFGQSGDWMNPPISRSLDMGSA
ncbi:MAG: hypothetical protein QOK38_413 [Acidobacteriaceae bacterium]|nr:hypothetical protein [Acidobacteriaceae bacterium]